MSFVGSHNVLDKMWHRPALRPYCPPLIDKATTVVEWINADGVIVEVNENEPSSYPDYTA